MTAFRVDQPSLPSKRPASDRPQLPPEPWARNVLTRPDCRRSPGNYAVGALLAGITVDLFGLAAAVWQVAGPTSLSGVIAAIRMGETLARAKA